VWLSLFFSIIICPAEKKRDFLQRKKNKPPHIIGRLLFRPAINLNGNANADFFIFLRLPFHAPIPTPPKKGALGLGWLSVTATPPPASAKKSFLRVGINNAFFASLGVFLLA
jgi:hypothetical protein